MDFKKLFRNKKALLILAAFALVLIIFLAATGRLSDLFAPAETGSDTVAVPTEATDAGETPALPTDPQQETAVSTEAETQPQTTPQPTEAATQPDEVTEKPVETATQPPEVTEKPVETATQPAETTAAPIDENGTYTSKEDVALYLHTYGKLPRNFVTKSQANAKGWSGGSLENYFPGCAIGGDDFRNGEKHLPTNTKYHECDIDTLVPNGKGGWKSVARGAKRIVYSDNGHIYYTEDHYETFTQLY